MHPVALFVAILWIAGLLAVVLIQVIATRSALTRILALDTFSTLLLALLAVYAQMTGSSYALDAALVLAALSFVGTIAAARFYRSGRLFE
jgi:multisubunit Na+/H+ antiporter MnhF subunit